MKFTTLSLMSTVLDLIVQAAVPNPQPAKALVLIAAAPMAVQGVVVLIVLIFGAASLAALWKSKP